MKSPRELKRRPKYGLLAGLLLLAAVAVGGILAFHPFAPASTVPTAAPAPTITPTPSLISQQQAVEAAIRIGSESRPEMDASSIPPSVTDASQTTLGQAVRQLNPLSSSVPTFEDPSLPVWLMHMDGSWLGAAAPGQPTPAPFLHLTLILDGTSGDLLFSSTGPGAPQPTQISQATLVGQATQTPRVPEDAHLAQLTLESFLGSLAAGPADSTFYQRAAAFYAGSWTELSINDPADSADHPKLLRFACEQGSYRCLTVRQVSPAEQLTPGPGRYRFWVQFNQDNGALYQDFDTTWFDFEIIGGQDAPFQVLDMPPLSNQADRQVVAHLSAAEAAGLNEAALLRALWADYMQRCKSSHVGESDRIKDYEIVSTLSGTVTFSVQPSMGMQSDWVAGGGDIQGDWVRNKVFKVKVFEESGVWNLKITGAG